MDTFWIIFTIVFFGLYLFGILKSGELDYLEDKKVKDYTLHDIFSIILVIMIVVLLVKYSFSLFK